MPVASRKNYYVFKRISSDFFQIGSYRKIIIKNGLNTSLSYFLVLQNALESFQIFMQLFNITSKIFKIYHKYFFREFTDIRIRKIY